MNTPTSEYPPLSPYLAVRNAGEAIDFYQRAFGASEVYRLTDSTTGKVGHAELLLNGALIMLADEFLPHNNSPLNLGGTTVKFSLMVDDVDASVARASAAGATVVMPPSDQFYGHRCAAVRDPFGHEWMLQHMIEKVAPAEMQKRWDAMPKG